MQLDQPVKWTAKRSEGFLSGTHGRNHVSTGEMALDDDGNILGIRVKSYVGLGGHLSTAGAGISCRYFGKAVTGSYDVPTAYCNVLGTFTNTAPVDANRGAGRPVPAASVAVAGTDAWTETDRSGYFLLEGVTPGDHVIEVRHVGYGAVADSVSLPADRTVEVRVALSADPVELEPLVVTALRDRRLEARGFYDRRRWGERTGRGRFLTAEEIGRRGPLRISHLLAVVPGIPLACRGSRGCAIRAARAPTCSHLTVYVDGVRMIGGDAGASAGRRGTVDELVGAADVAAVEVYPGPASVPGEFSGPTGQCGAVAIWTK
jgi:hypothetical protein